jgi:hypothetical protein
VVVVRKRTTSTGLENREYGRGDPLRWPRDTPYPRKLALTSATSGGRSVGIVTYNFCVKIGYQETSSEDKTFMCAVVTVIFRVYNSVSVVITVLKSVAKKRLLKTEDFYVNYG